MKKLLILMLIPVMTSLAGADLIMDVPEEVGEGETFSLTIRGLASDVSFLAQFGTQVQGGVETKDIEADETILNFGTVAAGSSITDNAHYDLYGSYDFIIVSPGGINGDTADGLWITINFTAGTGGDVYTFTRLDNSFDETTDVMTTTVLPEPMTMTLLALGGLMLRRKR